MQQEGFVDVSGPAAGKKDNQTPKPAKRVWEDRNVVMTEGAGGKGKA
jgi:hypothetical protein